MNIRKKIELAEQLPALKERIDARSAALQEMWAKGDRLLVTEVKPRAVVRFRGYLLQIFSTICFISIIFLLGWPNLPSPLPVLIPFGIVILIYIIDRKLDSRDD
tara:strand:+ start:726 stop:1037 length:312 start_codon:yes stop_codon:yes gene_type:complete